MRSRFLRLARAVIAVACLAVLVAQLAALLDLDPYEYRPLYALVGLRGVVFLLGINAGVIALLILTIRRPHAMPAASRLRRWLAWVPVGCFALLAVWALEWMFIETPPTARFGRHWIDPRPVAVPVSASADFDSFSLVRGISNPADKERLAVMYERVRLVNPQVFADHPIGQTIDDYSARYALEPALLFYLAYVHSLWGEAVSGRVPFLHAMTAETIRDVVQIHLPAWFVESTMRRQLAESDVLERIAGPAIGFKLRYAFHKATLDVSAQPYELNMFSDVMLVLQEYPDQFPDVLGADVSDPVRVALRDAFNRLTPDALEKPYADPYSVVRKDRVYYDANRADLKTFARAAYYATVLDFDLATRIAALLVDYQRKTYVQFLGDDAWGRLSAQQQAALLGMTRDVFVPNVGRPGYNSYALPEMNCTPVDFVARSAAAERDALLDPSGKLWRPRDYELLWGGAATKLRVFSEVWAASKGEPLRGLEPEATIDSSRRTVLAQQ